MGPILLETDGRYSPTSDCCLATTQSILSTVETSVLKEVKGKEEKKKVKGGLCPCRTIIDNNLSNTENTQNGLRYLISIIQQILSVLSTLIPI